MAVAITVEKVGDWERIFYTGPINEDAEATLAQMLANGGPKSIINFRGVETVNSCGVRAWINFLREYEKTRQVVFEECSPEIVAQINMIPNFKGKATVRSVYAAYGCGSCGHREWHLFEDGKNLPKDPTAEIEAVACSKCKATMEMEELEEEFFGWLQAS